MAPPRKYTPAELKARQQEQYWARVAKCPDKLCRAPRCTAPAAPLRDYCGPHETRYRLHGSVLAGTVSATDTRSMTRKVTLAIRRLDPELVRRVLVVIEREAITPGVAPLPERHGALDAAYALAVELHRLQSPPKGKRKDTSPVLAMDALIAVVTGWLMAVTPGVLTRRYKGEDVPVFDTAAAIALLVGNCVLRLRPQIYPRVYDAATGKSVRLSSRAAKQHIMVKRLLASRLMPAVPGAMLALIQADVLKQTQKNTAMVAARERSKEAVPVVPVVPAVVEPTGPSIFTFPTEE